MLARDYWNVQLTRPYRPSRRPVKTAGICHRVLRPVDSAEKPDPAQKFRAAAGGRALTQAQYLAALVALHEHIRHRADAGNDELKQLLDELGLARVTV